jgi:hypothetical protein
VLLGFVATDFVITITLSAADATAHILENPYVDQHLQVLQHPVIFTTLLIFVLGGVFLKGFTEAIGIAVVLVASYLLLNAIVIGEAMAYVIGHPTLIGNWKHALITMPKVDGNVWVIIGMALLTFPKLALGLSGFETGVAVMPLVRGPGRVRNTRKLLLSAALIMSVMLMLSSFVTTLLIPPHEFLEHGQANGRALAFLAHERFGEVFGTIYDLSTILILWFAGASAMAGLLNIVPRYLPRYGMAPSWATATRPLVLVFTGIATVVTIHFRAEVDAQGGAYATGVLVLMTSAAAAVAVSAWRNREKSAFAYILITLVFAYTTIQNVHERPEGIKIASIFIVAIVATSLTSRVLRSTELRVQRVELDGPAEELIRNLNDRGTLRIVTNRREIGDVHEYRIKEAEKRADNHIPPNDPIVFFEVEPGDASEFTGALRIRGHVIEGYRVLRTQSPAVPNAIAAFLLYLRDVTGGLPHVYFGWSEGNPLVYLIRYVMFGEGDTAPVTHEVLRVAEPDSERRPVVHVGG